MNGATISPPDRSRLLPTLSGWFRSYWFGQGFVLSHAVCRIALGLARYLVKPVEAHQIGPALMVAQARFGEWRGLQEENANLRQTLQNRKTIERAKGVLMKRHRWSEAEAFRRLQRAAMNRRTTMVDLAQSVLNGVEIEL